MKRWAAYIVPLALMFALVAVLGFSNAGGDWLKYPAFAYLPFALAMLAFGLGYFLNQSRVSFVGLLLAVVGGWLNSRIFSDPDPSMGHATLVLAACIVPVLTVILFHLGERGILNSHGVVRLAVVLLCAALIAGLPLADRIREGLSSSKSVWLGGIGGGSRLPLVGVVILAAGSPFFFVRREHDSPALGPAFFFASLSFLVGLDFRADLWKPGQDQAILLSFLSVSMLILIWAVMESLWRNAFIDELTELPGRRALKHHLSRLGSDYVLAVVDVDHFKKINDRHGHDTGDQVLRFVAAGLRENGAGKVYRFGGEEFVLVCEGMDYGDVTERMDHLRRAIHGREFVIRGLRRRGAHSRGKSPESHSIFSEPQSIRVSVSIGLASENDHLEDPQEVLKAADRALYRAKRTGRNRVCAAK